MSTRVREYASTRLVPRLPCALTSLGAVVGLVGVAMWPAPAAVVLVLLSLAVDAVDGTVARRLGQDSEAGAKLDWSVDVAMAYALVYRVAADTPWLAATGAGALVVLHSFALWHQARISGRTIVTALVVGAWALGLA